MKRFKALFLGLFALCAMMVASMGNAFAALTLPTLSTTDIETAAGTVFGGLAMIWAIRKLIKMLNRS